MDRANDAATRGPAPVCCRIGGNGGSRAVLHGSRTDGRHHVGCARRETSSLGVLTSNWAPSDGKTGTSSADATRGIRGPRNAQSRPRIPAVQPVKYISAENGRPVIELTRRNVSALLAKLDDPLSSRSLIDGEGRILVRAIEEEDRAGGEMAPARLSEGVLELTRRDLEGLLAALDQPGLATSILGGGAGIVVRAVEDGAHYRDRPPGRVWLPSRGQELSSARGASTSRGPR